MFSLDRFWALLALVAVMGGRSPSSVLELEKHTRAVEHGRLVEDIGIETLGGTFTPLLHRGQSVPCEVTETFSTLTDNQDTVEVGLFRGTSKLVKKATLIGRFSVAGLPRRPHGMLRLAVTFSVTGDGDVVVAAREGSGQSVRLVRDDHSEKGKKGSA